MSFLDYHVCSWKAHASPAVFDLRILTFAASDPTTWTLVSGSGTYTPTSHVCANPQAWQHPTNGFWYLMHSNADETFNPSWQNWPTASVISIARSSDGINFTPYVDLDYSAIADATFGSCWFADQATPSLPHLIIPMSTKGGGLGDTGHFQLYEVHPTTADATQWNNSANWSSRVQITGTSLPSSYQDPCIVDDSANGHYYLTFGTNGGMLANPTSSTTFPTSGWTVKYPGVFDLTGQNSTGDGPSLKPILTKQWYVYEQTSGGGIHYLNQLAGAGDYRGTDTNAWTGPSAVNGGNTERAGSIVLIQTPASSGRFATVFTGGVR